MIETYHKSYKVRLLLDKALVLRHADSSSKGQLESEMSLLWDKEVMYSDLEILVAAHTTSSDIQGRPASTRMGQRQTNNGKCLPIRSQGRHCFGHEWRLLGLPEGMGYWTYPEGASRRVLRYYYRGLSATSKRCNEEWRPPAATGIARCAFGIRLGGEGEAGGEVDSEGISSSVG